MKNKILILFFITINIILSLFIFSLKDEVKVLNEGNKLIHKDEVNAWNYYIDSNTFCGLSLNCSANLASRVEINSCTPLLIVNGHVCQPCLDGLFKILEEIKDSTLLIKDLKVVNTTNLIDESDKGPINFFGGFNGKVIYTKKIGFRETIDVKLPEVCMMLVDRELNVVSCFEYNKRYQEVFARALEKMNLKYKVLKVNNNL